MTNSSKPKSSTVGKTPTSSAKNSNDSKEKKHCPTCETTKSVDLFYNHKAFPDGKKKQCKECETAASRLRYELKKASGEVSIKNHKDTNRAGHLKRVYGITIDQYNELLESQDHCCAICRKHESEFNKRFSVDHAHTKSDWVPEGMIRGLLCFSCNHLVVGRHTDAKIFENASRYLRQHTDWRVPEEMTKGPKRKRKSRKKKI